MAIRTQSFDPGKAIEVIVFLANALPDPTFHSISKALYCSDRLHLERYGRLICGDHYMAMQYGPVPSHVYDMLKAPLGLEDEQLLARVAEAFTVRGRHSVAPLRFPDLARLSKSEMECLDEASKTIARMNFDQRTEYTHDDAWKNAGPNGVILAEDIAATLPNKEELLEHLRG